MATLPSTRELAWHEAHHCAAFLLLDWPPLVARIDWPDDRLGGSVQPDWESRNPDENTMHDLLVVTLMGPLADGGRPDDWLIDLTCWPDGSGKDAEQVTFIVQFLDLGTADFLHVCRRVVSLGREQRFRRLVVAIASELERKEIVLQPELIQLMESTI
jgi:hypothetical protein